MKHIGTLLILVGLGLGYYTLTINTSAVSISPDTTENPKDTLLIVCGVLIFVGLLITMYAARKGANDNNLS